MCRTKYSVLCVVLVFIISMMASFTFAETVDLSSGKVLFSDGQAEYSVSSSGLQVIAVDYEGRDIFDLTIKSNNEKSILYNLDRDGIHVVPMAAGKTKLTLTSRSDKKAKLDITVVVDEQAVASLDEGPLTAYLMSDYSYILPKDKPTLKYFICGGTKPYSKATIIPTIESEGTSGMYQELKSPKAYGKANLKIDTGTKSVQPKIMVVDAGLNTVETEGTPILVKHSLSVQPECILFRSPVNEPIEIPYTITGGSGKYSITEYITFMKDRNTLYENKRKLNSTGEGVISYTPVAEGYFGCRLTIQDSKTKEVIFYDPISVEITADERVMGVFDKTQITVDEPVTMKVSFSKIPETEPSFFSMGRMKYNGVIVSTGSDARQAYASETDQSFSKEIKKLDDLTYEVTFIPHCEGTFEMLLMTDGLFNHYGSTHSFIQVLR